MKLFPKVRITERIKKMDPDKFEAYVTGVSIGNRGKEKKEKTA